jgi:hypothetical protein
MEPARRPTARRSRVRGDQGERPAHFGQPHGQWPLCQVAGLTSLWRDLAATPGGFAGLGKTTLTESPPSGMRMGIDAGLVGGSDGSDDGESEPVPVLVVRPRRSSRWKGWKRRSTQLAG